MTTLRDAVPPGYEDEKLGKAMRGMGFPYWADRFEKLVAERAELQRLLDCAQKRIGELHDALKAKVLELPVEQMQQAKARIEQLEKMQTAYEFSVGEACAKANEERARARGYYANCDLGDDKRACYLKGYSAALTPLLEALLWIAGNAEVELTDCCVRIVSPEGEFVGEHDGSEDAFVAAIVQTHWKAREARR